MLSSLLALFAILFSVVQGRVHQVYVGDESGHKIFRPTTVSANVNDTVIFIFLSNHTVTQTRFSDPCLTHTALSSFDSGFLTAGQNFSVSVTSRATIWIRCTGHCPTGMVAAINAPDTGNSTFTQFQDNAKTTNMSSTTSSASSYSTYLTTSSTSSTSTSTSTTATPTTSRGAAAPRAVPFGSITIMSTIFALVVAVLAL